MYEMSIYMTIAVIAMLAILTATIYTICLITAPALIYDPERQKVMTSS